MFFKKTKSCATSAELTGDAVITNIMFHAYLMHSQAREYISQLMKSGLLGHRVSLSSSIALLQRESNTSQQWKGWQTGWQA
jgi:hypothetical protein